MVQMAGHAKTKLTKPKPQEASNDSVTEAFACSKTVEL